MEIHEYQLFQGSGLMAELRGAMRLWSDVRWIGVEAIEASGEFAIGPARVTVPEWTPVLEVGRSVLRLDGIKALSTSVLGVPTEGSVVRVTLLVEGEPVGGDDE